MGYIYILTSPSGKSYIGQTTRSIEKRFKAHRLESSRCAAISNAIRKYGWENFEKDWYECPDEDLNFDEDLLIREMETLSPGGYNLREGGGAHGKHSEESKQRMSEAKIGEKNYWFGERHTEESIQKMSEAQRGEKNHMWDQHHSEEARRKISESLTGEKNHNFGKPMSEDQKQKISESLTGIMRSEESRQKQSKSTIGEKNHAAKRVYQYALDGAYVNTFGSCGEAERYIKNKSGSKISMCATGELKTAYGFKWSYTEY